MQVIIVRKILDTGSPDCPHYMLPSEHDVSKCEDGLSVCLMAAQILGAWL